MIFTKMGAKKNLLLHYKNVDLEKQNLNQDLAHTNMWEIAEIIRVFNVLGWNVELVDRGIADWKPSAHYDLFISNASGNSGRMFTKMAKLIPNTYKVLYAAGPSADLSNDLVQHRYKNFARRNDLSEELEMLRHFDKIDIQNSMNYFSEVICIDDNGWSSETYKKYAKPIHKLRPSSSPNAFDNAQILRRKSVHHFVLFLGNGFIVKGADLVIEALREFPQVRLEVCGPFKSDSLFWKTYKNEIRRNPNINTHGFVKVGSKQYYRLVSNAMWQIHNSAAEGCATAITTLMQAGVIPISNRESGLNTTGIGINIENVQNSEVESTRLAIDKALNARPAEVDDFIHNIYFQRLRFSRQSFTSRLLEIVESISSKL